MSLEIGKTYFFRNPSADSYVGRLVRIVDPFTVVIDCASWVAQSGRLHVFIRDGSAPEMEIEFCGDGVGTRYQSYIPWPHKLFEESV